MCIISSTYLIVDVHSSYTRLVHNETNLSLLLLKVSEFGLIDGASSP